MATMGKATQSQAGPGQGLAPGQGLGPGQGRVPISMSTTAVTTGASTSAQKRVASAMIASTSAPGPGQGQGQGLMDEEEMMVERSYHHPPSAPGQPMQVHKQMRYMQSGLTSRVDGSGTGLAHTASGQGLDAVATGGGFTSEGGRGSGVGDGGHGNVASLSLNTPTTTTSDEQHVGVGVPRLDRPSHMVAPSVPNQSHVPISTSRSSSQPAHQAQAQAQGQAQTQPSRPADAASSMARAISQAIHTIAAATTHEPAAGAPTSTPTPSSTER